MSYPGYIQFGVGSIAINPVAGNLATPNGPTVLAILQDVSLDFDAQAVELRGQNQWPEDVAVGNRSIKGKGGFAALSIYAYNVIGFGGTLQTGTSSGVLSAIGEPGTVPGSSTYTITVAHSGTWTTDLGVFYAGTMKQLQPVASSPTIGQYTVAAGIYTFAAADASAKMLLSYLYTGTTNMLTVSQTPMGYGPKCAIELQMPYQSLPTACQNGILLNQCVITKLSAPQKRDNYVMSDFEFEAYPDPTTNKVFEWTAQYAM